jgi:plasmid maintenance system killer protein
LIRKYQKQIAVLGKNPRHPSLNLEILEPKNRGIYSFRLDKKYRGLFIYRDDLKAIEIIAVTCHYH